MQTILLSIRKSNMRVSVIETKNYILLLKPHQSWFSESENTLEISHLGELEI
jgi:hypothetical protein